MSPIFSLQPIKSLKMWLAEDALPLTRNGWTKRPYITLPVRPGPRKGQKNAEEQKGRRDLPTLPFPGASERQEGVHVCNDEGECATSRQTHPHPAEALGEDMVEVLRLPYMLSPHHILPSILIPCWSSARVSPII